MEDYFCREIDVISQSRLRQLVRRSNLQGFIQLSAHVGASVLTGTALLQTWNTLWTPVLFIIHGILINFLYAAQHELSHWSVFRRRIFNEIPGAIIGFFLIYPARWDQLFHFAHHRHTQDWTKDPELITRTPYTFRSYLLALTGITYWKDMVKNLLTVAMGNIPSYATWLSASQRRVVVVEARIHFLLYLFIGILSVKYHSWVAIQIWIGPMITTKFFHLLQNLSEHTGLTQFPEMLRNTRTLKAPWLVRRLVWNMSYHMAHHLYPAVPFHALPQLHREIEIGMGSKLPSVGYVDCQIEICKSLWKEIEPTTLKQTLASATLIENVP